MKILTSHRGLLWNKKYFIRGSKCGILYSVCKRYGEIAAFVFLLATCSNPFYPVSPGSRRVEPTVPGFYLETASKYIPVDFSSVGGDNTIMKVVTYINIHPGSYLFLVDGDILVNGTSPTLYSSGGYKELTVKGIGSAKRIHRSVLGNLFMLELNTTLILGENITIEGRGGNNNAAIEAAGGNLIMENGSSITGNSNINASNMGGGVYVGNGGSFTMNGGTISGNKAERGGGVYVAAGGSFIKTGGTIYGIDETDTTLQNNAGLTGTGAAVYAEDGMKYRDKTAWPDLAGRLNSGTYQNWND